MLDVEHAELAGSGLRSATGSRSTTSSRTTRRRSPTSRRASCCSTRTPTGRSRWPSTAARRRCTSGSTLDAEVRIRAGVSARARPPAAAPARHDSTNDRARALAQRRRAARDARHRRRAARRARAPGPHVVGAAGARAAAVARPARPAGAAAARRGGRGGRGAPAPPRGSSGPTTCSSTGARSRASSPRAARRRAGRCSGSASTSPCASRTCRPSCTRTAGTLGLTPADVEPTLGALLARARARAGARRPRRCSTAWRARDALRGREVAWAGGAGAAAGIDGAGRLVVELPGGGRTALDAGEVHLRREVAT